MFRSFLFHLVIEEHGLIHSFARCKIYSGDLVPGDSPRNCFVFALRVFQLCVYN